MDIANCALEEIALDGLEGCSFSTLVDNLNNRSPPVNFNLTADFSAAILQPAYVVDVAVFVFEVAPDT